ncbi:cache domain-containing protein [Geobacter sp. DSM 9736]|uniref:cache domain-containing protein n=1 Tax=Geobacter sp. DSM 9736 TaxID=1277350 RepID=UPI000B512162|nr:cache domain-containing protein [Geobacter sp. DSM 9736]SNB46012.1 two-component system, NtrC family, sensor kinase [Geobacter sp. DSM 9736]
MKPRRYPIRVKLALATLLPLTAAIIVCWLVGLSVINSRIASQAQEKVRTDLNAARSVYGSELEHIREVVKFTAGNPFNAAVIARNDRERLRSVLVPLLHGERLDVFSVIDLKGKVVFRAHNPSTRGDDKSGDSLIRRALQGEVAVGTDLMSPEETAREGADLASRAAVRLLPTPRARQRAESVEKSAMFLMAAAPVRDSNGRIIGALYGGKMLNGNNSLVDRIKSTVFEGIRFGDRDVGTATIFLDDLRIATNVSFADGTRAIGTRLSEEVYRKVNLQREKWIGRAFVVDDWYFAAYDPISDVDGNIIGSLYVGMLERPYVEMRREFSLVSAIVLLCGLAIGIVISGLVSSRLARPVRQLENVARRIAAGERNLPIAVKSGDEIGDLANEFSYMTRTLAQREEDIRLLNHDLERKVLERTHELEEKNTLLLKTQQELVRAGKLAAVGELAAGVAHEINNPMAIIRGNAELLQMAIPEDEENREEVDTILQQVGRVEKIVGNLLVFARQERKHLGRVNIPPLLDEIVRQVGHHVPLKGIRIVTDHDPDPTAIEGDGDQLRQVFTNLILNAIQAIEGGGTITLSSRCRIEAGWCDVTVADTGKGIKVEEREKIFNPFFTTRPGGTGLGLSVSYGIVKEHGGRIEVASTPGAGSIFTVSLPLSQSTVPSDNIPDEPNGRRECESSIPQTSSAS